MVHWAAITIIITADVPSVVSKHDKYFWSNIARKRQRDVIHFWRKAPAPSDYILLSRSESFPWSVHYHPKFIFVADELIGNLAQRQRLTRYNNSPHLQPWTSECSPLAFQFNPQPLQFSKDLTILDKHHADLVFISNYSSIPSLRPASELVPRSRTFQLSSFFLIFPSGLWLPPATSKPLLKFISQGRLLLPPDPIRLYIGRFISVGQPVLWHNTSLLLYHSLRHLCLPSYEA